MQPPPPEAARSPSPALKRLIDSAPEPEFDDLVYAATSLTERPIGTIGFVDRERIYLKAELWASAS